MANQRVALYLGTRKGTYVARSDAQRRKWKVEGPFQTGTDVFHVAPDPRHPGTAYALANNPFFGPVLYRTTDEGRKWREIATPGLDRSKARTPSFEEDRPPLPIENLWHLEPGPASAPRRLFIGVSPHYLYRSEDSGRSWVNVTGIAEHPTRSKWAPGAGGRCLHTVIVDPKNPQRMYVGISAAGTFRSDDGGVGWSPCNRGVSAGFLPVEYPEVGQCVHHVALDTEDPKVAYRQDHGGIYISEDGMDHWQHVGKGLDSDFGFVVATAPGLPGGAVFAPLNGEDRLMAKHRAQLQWYDRAKQRFRPMIKNSSIVGEFGTHREGLAIDRLDPAGIYLGSTTGDVIYSPNGGRSWGLLPFRFPGIHSVSVATS